MKKLLPVFLLMTFVAQAQEPFKYRMQVDLAAGGTLFNIPNSLSVTGKPQAFGICVGADVLFSVKGPFSIGISGLHHTYDTQPENSTGNKFIEAKSTSLQFIAQYHLIDKKKINLAIGTGVGVHGFNYDRMDVIDSVEYKGHVTLKGSAFLFNLELRYYFIKNLGLFFRPQFLVYGGKLDEYTINGTSPDRIEGKRKEEILYSFRGASAQIGLSLRF
ncbi:MAG TPA: autotransporter outer membrane beta-barrel domain-containing protein [Flavobacteriales bacterium]|nr:autotransporter outer membrane beta-barrel domain-containing protein [Flavobacteriales bacterium]